VAAPLDQGGSDPEPARAAGSAGYREGGGSARSPRG
jgi:hypothetical protein